MDNKTELIQALEYYEDTNMHIVDRLLTATANLRSLELMSFDAELLKFISK